MTAAKTHPGPVEFGQHEDHSGTYESRRLRVRIRLTAEEQRSINYVLVGWESEIGMGSAWSQHVSSNSGEPGVKCATHIDPPDHASPASVHADFAKEARACERCAEMRVDRKEKRELGRCADHKKRPRGKTAARLEYERSAAKCRACANARQRMTVQGAMAEVADGPGTTHAIERWVNKPAAQRQRVVRCWRALKLVAEMPGDSMAVLRACYGDTPPGLPSPGLWPDEVDQEYRRVVRLVDGSGRSSAALEALVRVDKRHYPSEAIEAYRARVVAQECARRAVLSDLGAKCERLIEKAANDFRMAWLEAK